MARAKTLPVPEVGQKAPEFHLPSAQGGQLKLSVRTVSGSQLVSGTVVVVFYRGTWSEEDVEYFKELAEREDEINHAAATVVGIGATEPSEAREFVRKSGIKSYVLYDYARVATREWGLLEKDKEHGEHARPAAFIVDSDHNVVHAWVGERPPAEEILAKVREITGPDEPDEEEESEGEAGSAEEPEGSGEEEKSAEE